MVKSQYKTAQGVIEAGIGLRCMFGEYNCTIKTIGRLEPHVKDLKTGEEVYAHSDPEAFEAHKAEILKEFGAWLCDRNTFGPLKDNSRFFPSDSGRYPATMFLYADQVRAEGKWFNHFPSLIRELETHPEHGWQVYSLPTFLNATYRSSFAPSKVWAIVPPGQTDLMLLPGSDATKKWDKEIKASKSPWLEDLKEAATKAA